jgi:hypothetical protein
MEISKLEALLERSNVVYDDDILAVIAEVRALRSEVAAYDGDLTRAVSRISDLEKALKGIAQISADVPQAEWVIPTLTRVYHLAKAALRSKPEAK